MLQYVFLAGIGSAALLKESEYAGRWADFKVQFNRKYSNKEHDHRYTVFKSNIDKIETHNAKGLSYWLGVNDFADLTEEEFSKKISCGNITNPDHDPERIVDKRLTEVFVEPKPTNSTGAIVDWAAAGYVTPVKNQGQCGGCWAFATTGSIESATAIKTKKLYNLSEQQLIDCSSSYGNMGCNGGVTDWGFKYVIKEGGLCAETTYTYKAQTITSECDRAVAACGSEYCPLTSYQDVRRSEAALQQAVTLEPVTVAIEANTAFQLYRGGVFTATCGTQLNHGILAVGYGTDGYDYWKVKNSWGPGWGEQGYIRLQRNSGQNGNVGLCGIAQQASYPLV